MQGRVKNPLVARSGCLFASVAASCAILATSSYAIGQPTGVHGYESTPMGDMSARRVDDLGRVLGHTIIGDDRPAVWINGIVHELTQPTGYRDIFEMNISPTTGVIVGQTWAPREPIAWTAKSTRVLKNLGSAECTLSGVNDSGWMVGFCDSPMRAGLWIRRQEPVDLGDLGGRRAGADDINEHGEIVGWSYRPDESIAFPVMWRDGKTIDLFKVSGFEGRGFASAINNLSEVVGECTGIGNPRAGYHWHEGELTILPEPGPCNLTYDCEDINDAGLMVGKAGDPDCQVFKGVVWDRNQGFQPFYINDYLIGSSERWIILARAINNAGQIAAFGELETGEESSFLVTPYQFDLSEPAPGIAGERNTITVTSLEPDQRVILVFGTKEGAQPIGNGCLGGLVLIRDASTHQSLEAFADNSGVATFNVLVPKSTAGKTVRYQAVAPDECEISHTIEFTF